MFNCDNGIRTDTSTSIVLYKYNTYISLVSRTDIRKYVDTFASIRLSTYKQSRCATILSLIEANSKYVKYMYVLRTVLPIKSFKLS